MRYIKEQEAYMTLGKDALETLGNSARIEYHHHPELCFSVPAVKANSPDLSRELTLSKAGDIALRYFERIVKPKTTAIRGILVKSFKPNENMNVCMSLRFYDPAAARAVIKGIDPAEMVIKGLVFMGYIQSSVVSQTSTKDNGEVVTTSDSKIDVKNISVTNHALPHAAASVKMLRDFGFSDEDQFRFIEECAKKDRTDDGSVMNAREAEFCYENISKFIEDERSKAKE